MGLVEKLESTSNRFPMQDFGVSRHLILGTMPELFGINLSDEEKRELGIIVQKKIHNDFERVLIPQVNNALFMRYGVQIPSFEFLEEHKVDCELELLYKLAQRNLPKGLESATLEAIDGLEVNKDNICGASKNDVDLFFIEGKDLKIKHGLDYLILKRKTVPSLPWKFLSRVSKILSADDDILIKLGLEPSTSNRRLVKNIGLKAIKDLYSSNVGFFDRFISNRPSLQEYNYDRTNSMGCQEDMGSFQLLNSHFDVFLDAVEICDYVGANYAVTSEFEGGQLTDVLKKTNNNTIFHKCKNYMQLGIKDLAVTLGQRGFFPGSSYETRIQQTIHQYESKFGSSKSTAHFKYDVEELRRTIARYKRSKGVKSVSRNLELMFEIKKGNIFKFQR